MLVWVWVCRYLLVPFSVLLWVSRSRVSQWSHWFRLASWGAVTSPPYSPITDITGFQFLHTCSNPHLFLKVCFVCCFYSRPRGCEMLTHHGFDWCFPSREYVGNLGMCLLTSVYLHRTKICSSPLFMFQLDCLSFCCSFTRVTYVF